MHKLSLWGGPLACGFAYLLLPSELGAGTAEAMPITAATRWVIGLVVWMAWWWLSEAVPLPVTALLPVTLLPLLGVTDIAAAARPYADPLIFLFLGGFVLAIAVEKWGLHRRFAFRLLAAAAGSPRRLVAGFMGATGFLSLWLSNTATTILMLPVALSVASTAATSEALRKCLLLGVAYAATIGGMGTLIGTPPNAFVASFLASQYGVVVDFQRWLVIGLPMVFVMLPATWWFLTAIQFPVDGSARIVLPADTERSLAWSALGSGARTTLAVFLLAATAWITRPWLAGLTFGDLQPFAALSDAGVAMLAALALLVLPFGDGGRSVVGWDDCLRLPWGTLILFGGGLSLAAAITATGADRLVGAALAGLPSLPRWLVVALIAAVVVFISELASNIATTAAMAPLLAAAAAVLGLSPASAAVVTALAASAAFMMPVGTAPNALVYGTGHVSAYDMASTGIVLNLLSIALLTAIGSLLVPVVFA